MRNKTRLITANLLAGLLAGPFGAAAFCQTYEFELMVIDSDYNDGSKRLGLCKRLV